MNTVIRFEDITKEYEGKTIIENLNLSIGQGEFVTIIGSSGCGKTTTLKMVNGLIKPEKGTITYHFVMRLWIGWLVRILMRDKADYTRQWYQLHSWCL